MSKQEKLRELADRIDHDKLWRQPAMDRDKLTQDQRDRLDAGVMLRRYSNILEPGRWLVIPPTGSVQFSAGTLDKAFEMAKRDEGRKAATEAAKATGTAGEQTKQSIENIEELVPLPEPDLIAYVPHGPNDAYSETLLREFRAKVYETARRDKDGNHADDLRGMLDELQAQYDQQEAAFMGCSAKLQQVEQELEAARQPAPATLPPVVGVSRDADSPGMNGVLVTFARPLSDGQLRELHEYLNRSKP